MGKQRLDMRVAQEYPRYSRSYIRSIIMQGNVLVDDHPVTKAGTPVREDQVVRIKASDDRFVCRSGWKMAHAIEAFGLSLQDKVILDAGISTGGFTDCVLQAGSARVYGVDVGHGQVHGTIAHDPRVTLLERTNLRYLSSVGEPIDMATLDLSFISVLKVMDSVTRMLKPAGELVVLIKPQFEAARREVPKGGVIRDTQLQKRIVDRVIAGIVAFGYTHIGTTASPVQGAKGNQEYIAYLSRSSHAE